MCGSSNETHLGFIAQEVEEAAITNDCYSSAIVWKDDYYKLNKPEFIALNTWQIQKLKTRVTELENEIKEIKQRYEI